MAFAMQPVNGAGGLTLNASAGPLRAGQAIGVTLPVTITVSPKLQEGAELKVWGTASGPYGLPSACGLKTSPSTPTEDVYAALEAFAAAECRKAAEGLTGQAQAQVMGMRGGMLGISVQWTPAIQALSFEGDDIPRSAAEAVGQFLKDGEDFQARGTLSQSTAAAGQSALAGLMGANGRNVQEQLDALQQGRRPKSSSCCSLL
uniref:Uncharacterized protein n=1 Tax=Alexandrium monilatum TaxID=311494 RepID=A0A7S4QMM0_9DINO